MIIGRISGATRVLGKSQGFLGLPVRDEVVEEARLGQGILSMVTAWIPNPDELERLINGAAVHVRIYGSMHPPIMVEVGPEPTEGGEEP